MRVKSIVLAAALLSFARLVLAANPGDEVIVVYNSRVPESKSVAEHYAELRHVPPNQVLGFSLPTTEEMTRTDFRDNLQRPLAKALEQERLWRIRSLIVPGTNAGSGRVEWRVSDSKIRYAVLCYGVPLRIRRDPNLKERVNEAVPAELRVRNEAAVDNELA